MSSSQRTNRRLVIIAGLLLMVSVALLIALIVVATNDDDDDAGGGDNGNSAGTDTCSYTHPVVHEPSEEPTNPSVFHDLTMKEIKGLNDYLYQRSGLDLVQPSDNKDNANFVFLVDLHIPDKDSVIEHLDNGGVQPDRQARVVIIHAKPPNQQINEYIVGPLPTPSYHRAMPGINQSLPFFYRPMTEDDYGQVLDYVTDQVHDEFASVLQTCFGSKLKDCGDECLTLFYASPFSPASSGKSERLIWYWLNYEAEYYSLHPLDMAVLVWIQSDNITIDKVWFFGQQYGNLGEAQAAFDSSEVTCTPRSFPHTNKELFSTLHKRGRQTTTKRPPLFVEPDGRRYEATGKHVEYMNWAFDFRLSTAYGPVLYDVRFDNERIVYELGLQEISVFYSGHSPQQRFSDYMDSGELIGPSAQGLIPGVDCPSHSTYFDTVHITETSTPADKVRNVFCLFELNTGEPLRRHHSYFKLEGHFYEGLENVVLVLRTILTVVNYDYVIDFRFYEGGMLQVKSMSTGYVLANAFSELEKKYGYQIHDHITANFHLHLFNFKVDLDVKGRTNSYEVIKMEAKTEPNAFSAKPGSTYSQVKLVHEVVQTEQQAAYKYNFDNPKYHIFYNQNDKNTYGNPKAYRLINEGMVKQVLPEGANKEPAINWARYQFAVTKQKHEEAHSSSMYSVFDALNQVVNFQSYIDDNESIVDQDLVVWVTIGLQHIPHTEDLPVTTTAGTGISFYLQPYNYFIEDPAMASPHAVRFDPGHDGKVHRTNYGVPGNSSTMCIPGENNYMDMVQKDPTLIFEEV